MKKTLQSQTNNTKNSLTKDTSIHLRSTKPSIHKDNRHLKNTKPRLKRLKLHLNLKRITLKLNPIQPNSLQHLPAITHKPRRRIMNRQPRNQPHILRSKIRHKHTPHRPVDHIHTTHITRTNSSIIPLHSTLLIQPRQILRRMTKIRVHLKNKLIITLQGPLKPSDISRPQPKLTPPLKNKETVVKLLFHKPLHHTSRTIGRIIIHHENMKIIRQRKHRPDNFLNIFNLVKSRDYYDTIVIFHSINLRIIHHKNKNKKRE